MSSTTVQTGSLVMKFETFFIVGFFIYLAIALIGCIGHCAIASESSAIYDVFKGTGGFMCCCGQLGWLITLYVIRFSEYGQLCSGDMSNKDRLPEGYMVKSGEFMYVLTFLISISFCLSF